MALQHVLSGSDAHFQLSRRMLEHQYLEASDQLRCSSPLCKQALRLSGAHGQHPDTGTSTSFMITYAHFELGGYRRLPERKRPLSAMPSWCCCRRKACCSASTCRIPHESYLYRFLCVS